MKTIGERLDTLLEIQTNEFLDRPSDPGMEADVLTEDGVGGNPSQPKPPMGLDCWNRLYWYFQIYLPTGRAEL